MTKSELLYAYETLESDFDDTIETIKKRYKKLAMKHHPDRGGDINKIKNLNKAFQLISEHLKFLDNKPDYFIKNRKKIEKMVHDIIFGEEDE